MPEYLHGARCLDCPQVITLPVDIQDVRDDEGLIVDVSVEVDMSGWHAHAATHRRSRTLTFNILGRGSGHGFNRAGT